MRATNVLLALALVPTGTAVHAQAYPSKPIRIIVPSGAGGITDILARLVAQKVGEQVGQQMVVDNRPGASGIVGSEMVARATPDGYTLLMVFPTHPVNPSLFAKMPYDTVKDFAPIGLVGSAQFALVANPSLGAKTVAEFVQIARARPGQDIVDEFCDALWLEDGLSKNTLDAYKRDLLLFADWLHQQCGKTVFKLNFNAGDELCFPATKPNTFAYTDTFQAFPDFLSAFIREHRIEAVVCFGPLVVLLGLGLVQLPLCKKLCRSLGMAVTFCLP